MDLTTIGLGGVVAMFGVFTHVARASRPEQFTKLEAMQRALGLGTGRQFHTTAYTVAPVVAGVILVLAGLRGIAIL